jgi:hypothetical protein
MLSPDFFNQVFTKTEGKNTYEAYVSKYPYSTMVLYSTKTMTPLAALLFKPHDKNVTPILTGRPSPSGITEPYF